MHMLSTQFVGTEFLFKAIYLLVTQVTPVQLLFVASAKGLMAAGEGVCLYHRKHGVTEGIFMNETATLVPDVKKSR